MDQKAELEALIERAGRERVFEIARSLGWRSGDAVPAYVWRDIATNLISDPKWRPPGAVPSLGEPLGLTWLFGGLFG